MADKNHKCRACADKLDGMRDLMVKTIWLAYDTNESTCGNKFTEVANHTCTRVHGILEQETRTTMQQLLRFCDYLVSGMQNTSNVVYPNETEGCLIVCPENFRTDSAKTCADLKQAHEAKLTSVYSGCISTVPDFWGCRNGYGFVPPSDAEVQDDSVSAKDKCDGCFKNGQPVNKAGFKLDFRGYIDKLAGLEVTNATCARPI